MVITNLVEKIGFPGRKDIEIYSDTKGTMKLNHVNQCTLSAPRTLRDIDSDDTSNGHHATARLVLVSPALSHLLSFLNNDELSWNIIIIRLYSLSKMIT